MGIFKSLTIKQITMAIVLAAVFAIALSAVVSLLPIGDNHKIMALLILGITSMFLGYVCLERTRATKILQKPATNNIASQKIEPCNPDNEMNHILDHTPKNPKKDNAIRKNPSNINTKAQNASDIILHLLKYLVKRILTTIK